MLHVNINYCKEYLKVDEWNSEDETFQVDSKIAAAAAADFYLQSSFTALQSVLVHGL